MISIGKKYNPVNARITKSGSRTMFSLPQSHKEGARYIQDGFIQIVADGIYDFKRGDSILIKAITGASIYAWSGNTGCTYSIFADIDYITEEAEKAAPNKARLEDDIPDDLF